MSEAVHQGPNEFHTLSACGEHTKLITEAESLRWGFYLLMQSPLLHDPSVGKAEPNTPLPRLRLRSGVSASSFQHRTQLQRGGCAPAPFISLEV